MVTKYYIFAIIVFVLTVILNEMSVLDMFFLLLSYILVGMALVRFPVQNHSAEYLALVVYYMSVIFLPSLHLVFVFDSSDAALSSIDYSRMLKMGSSVFFAAVISFIFFASIISSRRNKGYCYTPKRIKQSNIKVLFAFMFILTIFSFSIGLGRMGVEAIVLPFHLGGIINILRFTVFPGLFAIIVENYILRKKRIPRFFYVLFALWCILEIFTRLSKGAILTNTLPVLAVLFFYYRPPIRKIVKVLAPILVVFFLLYPIVQTLRSSEFSLGSMKSDISEAKSISDEGDNSSYLNMLLVPLNREFLTCYHFRKDYDYIDHQALFDFSNAPAIIAYGGSAGFQTFVIDNIPLWATTSSGTTGIMDPLLIGGYGLCYIVVFFMFLFARFVSRLYQKKKYTAFFILFMMIESLITGSNVSKPFDGVSFQYLLAGLFVVYLAYYFNYKRKVAVI